MTIATTNAIEVTIITVTTSVTMAVGKGAATATDAEPKL
jgi:hypothetical protein